MAYREGILQVGNPVKPNTSQVPLLWIMTVGKKTRDSLLPGNTTARHCTGIFFLFEMVVDLNGPIEDKFVKPFKNNESLLNYYLMSTDTKILTLPLYHPRNPIFRLFFWPFSFLFGLQLSSK
eukprot:TRINITY_DN5457_c0_g1_i1.p1 TRINITY_DN5457_c0_g1~~TRINITY_DN5457_c0_g1_i1.p1  ORF type:complete len:122 (+),score=15.63 TRINITY_DN5457_c0_g1_i1:107-472(+)